MTAHPRQEGLLRLRLERHRTTTRPAQCVVLPPLQLSRVRYDDPAQPELAFFTLLHLGGILDGDHYHLDVSLGPDAAAHITTAAATQVYRMPNADASQELTICLEAGSRLAWLPEPLILFGGARFAQTTRVELAPGAQLALLDVLVPGRLARGEAYQFERYESRLEVCDHTGRCLVAGRACLEPRRRSLAVPGVLHATPVAGSLYLLGSGVDAGRGAELVSRRGAAGVGAAVLPNNAGLLIRALGTSPSQVRALLIDLLRLVG